MESKKTRIFIYITSLILICFLLSCISVVISSASTSGYRAALWMDGGVSTVSNSETLTLNALKKYAISGVWGSKCALETKNNSSTDVSSYLTAVGNVCVGPNGKSITYFYSQASNYASIVSARMALADPTGNRLDDAMVEFSDVANDVFAILIGFGALTSVLVFTVLFMKLAWIPTHAMEKRRFMIDIATAGTATLLLGNIWLVISLFQASFNRFWQTFAVYSKEWRTVANMVLVEYKGFIVGISGIATLLVLAMFVINFMMLAYHGSNVSKRSERISSLISCAIAAAGLGSITIITGFFWNMFA